MTNRMLPRYPYYEDKNYVSGIDEDKTGPFYEYLRASDFENPQNAIDIKKGEMTGRFEMGSTIVLIFEASKDTQLTVSEGQKL